MFHLNELCRQHPKLRILEFLLPEVYVATTIADFETNKGVIRPTKRIVPWGVLFYGGAVIQFGSSVIYNSNSSDPKRGRISDLTSSLDVDCWWWIDDKERESLKDGVRLYKTEVFFNLKKGSLSLTRFDITGPVYRERKPEEERLPEGAVISPA